MYLHWGTGHIIRFELRNINDLDCLAELSSVDCVNGLVIACLRNALNSNRLTPMQTSTAPNQFGKCNLLYL